MKKTIDTRGKDCPIPLMELKKEVAKSTEGQIIEVIFTCPEAVQNLPRYAQEQGFEVVEFNPLQRGVWSIIIKI